MEMLSAMRTIGRATALLTTPAPEPPARGVIENYRLFKPKSAPRSAESVSNVGLDPARSLAKPVTKLFDQP